jgi:hypothetical protein
MRMNLSSVSGLGASIALALLAFLADEAAGEIPCHYCGVEKLWEGIRTIGYVSSRVLSRRHIKFGSLVI